MENLGPPYWAWIHFLIHGIWTPKILELPYWTRNDFMIYWSST